MKTVRCAVYTRKSSEEGLDQSFNSIDAQREACEAYILSQRHEGWKVLPGRYDDGGFSGGNLERPALQRLLAEIQAGSVDLIVVYKIDRLTRSLADFAKMVEIFDEQSTSFVSVTQHFNTTTSMGRLTLNVLLSFAQFEREVTGERIRDKIAASKKKGMWMGGTVPLGYNAVDRQLTINQKEAEVVRSIFELYLENGNVRLLKARLDAAGIKSKTRTSKTGNTSGGLPFREGAVYKILQNRVYVGEIPHKETWYAGNHAPIIDLPLFQRVQTALEASSDGRRKGIKASESSLLAGWVFDMNDNRLLPSHAVKAGKRYRYYVSRPKRPDDPRDGEWAPKTSIPANDLERLIVEAIANWLRSPPAILKDLRLSEFDEGERRSIVRWGENFAERLSQAGAKAQRELLLPMIWKILVGTNEVRILLRRNATLTAIGFDRRFDPREDEMDEELPVLHVAARMKRYGLEMRLIVNEEWAKVEQPEPDPTVVRLLAQAHSWWTALKDGRAKSIAEIAAKEGLRADYAAKVLRAALISPELMESLLQGRSVDFKSKDLLGPMPNRW